MEDGQSKERDQSQQQNHEPGKKSAEQSLEELGFENLTTPGHWIAIIGSAFNDPSDH